MISAVEILPESRVCHSLFVAVTASHDLLRYLGPLSKLPQKLYPFHPVSDHGARMALCFFQIASHVFLEQPCDVGKMYHSSW